MDILNQEVKERVDKGIGIVEKGAPRVMTLYENYSDPSITRMIENAGLAISASVWGPPPKAKSKVAYTTLGEEIAAREMRLGVYHSNFGWAERCKLSIDYSNVDGVIFNYLYNCRPIAQTSHIVRKYINEKIGIPFLSLENDIYDTRSYSPTALRTKVETFAEMLKARKASTRA
jgi:benzoyl-CoA reductase/2-hydroxyglutaryl-CoA dehydratase subunit BcrC/BadD/HgdB